MPVWQHVNGSDHLRRRAESLIEAGRRKEASSAATRSVRDAQRREIMSDMRETVALGILSGLPSQNS